MINVKIVLLIGFFCFSLAGHDVGATEIKQNKNTLDSILAIREYVAKISHLADEGTVEWTKNFDANQISELMTYTENGKKQYVIFGELTNQGKLTYDTHQSLFFLVNDVKILKTITQSKDIDANKSADYILEYLIRISINSAYLEQYMNSLAENVKQGTLEAILKKQDNTAKEIYEKNQKLYISHIKALIHKNKQYNEIITKKVQSGGLNNVPLLPIVMGNILDSDADFLNIYMSKDMGRQLREWLSKQQAQTFGSN